jgi:hypothetical protein
MGEDKREGEGKKEESAKNIDVCHQADQLHVVPHGPGRSKRIEKQMLAEDNI